MGESADAAPASFLGPILSPAAEIWDISRFLFVARAHQFSPHSNVLHVVRFMARISIHQNDGTKKKSPLRGHISATTAAGAMILTLAWRPQQGEEKSFSFSEFAKSYICRIERFHQIDGKPDKG
jgi:hypothetical protein